MIKVFYKYSLNIIEAPISNRTAINIEEVIFLTIFYRGHS